MIEDVVLASLIYNEEYTRRVFPFLKEEYFDTPSQKTLFKAYSQAFSEYNTIPTKEVMAIKVDGYSDLNEVVFDDSMKLLSKLKIDEKSSIDFLVDETEKFCKEKAVFNALRESIAIIDGKDKKSNMGAIPKILEDALGISFDTNVGHDYLEDFESRYEYYHRTETRIPFDIDILNYITRGGLPPKSLTILAATTGGGKSLTKCHMAASAISQGKNVLYITMELAEEEVSKRIDANLFDLDFEHLMEMSQAAYIKKMKKLKETITGKLVIKEFPTGQANAGTFRHLLNELKMKKKGFKPDIIFIDYLNICSSFRYKGSADQSYMLIKAISEELRGLAMEFNLAVVTSTQLNRGGYNNSEIDLTNLSESMGPAHTADFMVALIATEEFDEQGKIMFKQLKNRWGDLAKYRKFMVGIDRGKMKLINISENKQPVLSNGGTDDDNERQVVGKKQKKSFDKEKAKKLVF